MNRVGSNLSAGKGPATLTNAKAEAILNEVVEKMNDVLRSLRIEIYIKPDDDEVDLFPNLVDDITEAIVDRLKTSIENELKTAGLRVDESEAEGSSNDYAVGLRFRWTRVDIPVCKVGRYEINLGFVKGHSRVIDWDAPEVLHDFQLYVETEEDK